MARLAAIGQVPFFVLAFAFFAVLPQGIRAQARPDALVELRLGNFQRALEIGISEIAANRENMDSYVVLCRALIGLGRYDEAMQYADTAMTVNRYDTRMIEVMGELYYFSGLNAEALRYFQQYVNAVPEGSHVHFAYYYTGEIFIRTGMFRHADIALTAAVHMVPGNADWWARLGFARESAGDISQALTAYEKSLALNATGADARHGMDRVRVALSGR
jgi:tetratricopeptide (TPR) repeat protein